MILINIRKIQIWFYFTTIGFISAFQNSPKFNSNCVLLNMVNDVILLLGQNPKQYEGHSETNAILTISWQKRNSFRNWLLCFFKLFFLYMYKQLK